VEFRADPQRQAFRGEQIGGLRHHHVEMIQLEECGALPAIAQESFHAVVEPIGRQARLYRYPRCCFPGRLHVRYPDLPSALDDLVHVTF
jgi:hypothetical protein